GIVHRLDKDTSGVMVVAKNDAAHHALARQFAAHSISRIYLALVAGVPLPLEGEIATLIARHAHHRQKMAVSKTRGKEAVTHYKVKEIFKVKGQGVAALMECRLETGRTHQVRVHLAHLGHPVLGDALYGRGRAPKNLKGTAAGEAFAAFPRQALHAALLAFDHPLQAKRMTFKAPLPSDMKALAKTLKALK
ncbi:MAG TPA: RluA family pseudouridine synthase, partial [Sphingomonadales bacterium]|nr:RluA family pseudouridine synthase [Sphingomonadales bacterium]